MQYTNMIETAEPDSDDEEKEKEEEERRQEREEELERELRYEREARAREREEREQDEASYSDRGEEDYHYRPRGDDDDYDRYGPAAQWWFRALFVDAMVHHQYWGTEYLSCVDSVLFPRIYLQILLWFTVKWINIPLRYTNLSWRYT